MRVNGATIPDPIVERVIERRGAEHSFANLDPARTALVVIDLQHAFMNDAVGFAAVPAARYILPAVHLSCAAPQEAAGDRVVDEAVPNRPEGQEVAGGFGASAP